MSCRTDRAKYGLRVHPAPELDDQGFGRSIGGARRLLGSPAYGSGTLAGFLTTFDGPRWPSAARPPCGLHDCECEVIGANLDGIVVHIGARVTAMAALNEVLVSGSGR
jgi:hypothetical protein